MSRYSERLASLSPAKQALLARELASKLDELEQARTEPIAIIGMACRFPGGASDPESLWRLLEEGVDAIRDVPEDRWPVDAFYDPDPEAPGKIVTRSGGFVEEIDAFDAHFFQISPHDADRMDPQHRWLLEVAWQALEDAAQNPTELLGARAGVFLGIIGGEHALAQAASGLDPSVIDGALGLGVTAGIAAGRLSYFLGLQGPSLTVDTQCSSSLVATHLACESLRTRECDLALAGGVQAMLAPFSSIFLSQARALSPDGRCKAFDAAADGYGRGEGCGIIVLKRLSDAIAQRDNVLALIRGSAVNHGGRSGGLVIPNGMSQKAVIRDALRRAAIQASAIDYLEAHGTGTQLGDPIELDAAGAVLREGRGSDRPLWIGSIKTNIGHAEAAAGIAGLIKVVLSMQHGIIPPHLHFRNANEHIRLAEIPACVPTQATPWPSKAGERNAGVSSFGLGGTNAHVVVSDFVGKELPEGGDGGPKLLVLSAKTKRSLDIQTSRLAEHLRCTNEASLADIAYTLQVGRRPFPWRRALICSDPTEAAVCLDEVTPSRVLEALAVREGRPVGFMFSGVGEHYANMALGLYRKRRVFREWVDKCCDLVEPHLGFDLRRHLFAPSANEMARSAVGSGAGTKSIDLRRMLEGGEATAADESMNRATVAQPAVFAIEFAMAQLWKSWGVHPDALIGHSIGELTAACVAEVFELEDALKLVAERARLIEEAPRGAMLAVNLGAEELRPLLGEGLSLAAVNAPTLCVVAGEAEAVAALESQLSERRIARRSLRTRHAFHSHLLEEAGARFSECVASVKRRAPTVPFVSNVTGAWITAEEATDPRYWGGHLSATVQFAKGLETLGEDPERMVLEVGPGQSLTSFALQRVRGAGEGGARAVASIRSAYDRSDDEEFVLGALARLWLAGVEPAWEEIHGGEGRRRVRLPTYAFDRQQYRLAASPGVRLLSAGESSAKQSLADWFYAPIWKQSRIPLKPVGERAGEDSPVLLFLDEWGLGKEIADHLEREGRDVVAVSGGPAFRVLSSTRYAIDPSCRADYSILLKTLRSEGRNPSEIYHFFSLDGASRARTPEEFDRAQDRGFYSLLFLVQALGADGTLCDRRVAVVTTGTQDVLGTESLRPENATLVGPSRVTPAEYPGIQCRLIDVDLSDAGLGSTELLATRLAREIQLSEGERVVAYRAGRRWVQQFDRVRMDKELADRRPLRSGGVYWIVGGLGSIGLELGRYLAAKFEARLVLTGRSTVPPREEWDEWLEAHDAGEPLSVRIKGIREMEASGAKVLVAAADVTDAVAMADVVAAAKREFGRIDGVFHAAGVPGAGVVGLKTREMAEAVLAPKAKGALVLEEVLRSEALDFVVYFSSLFSILGGVGQVDYCGANAFLDTLACERKRHSDVVKMSILWGAWTADPWQDRLLAETPALQQRMREFRVRVGINIAEGMEALLRCLSAKLPCTLVSPPDLATLRAQMGDVRLSGVSGLAASGRRLHDRPALTTEFVAPRTDIERRVAEIWQGVLGLTEIGVHDGFLELGGNSLLATQIAARTTEAFEIECPVNQLFVTPTVAEFAGAVAESDSKPEAPGLERPTRVGREGALAVSPSQERLWYLDRLEPGNPAYNYVLAARLRGPLDVGALEAAVRNLVTRHEILRTVFPSRDGRPVQVIVPPEGVRLERLIPQRLDRDHWETEWRRTARAFSRLPFDLTNGPLVRVLLLERASDDHVLLAAAHHMVIDHLSVPIFLAEIGALYETHRRGEAVDFPELPIQYADFAHWQQRRLADGKLEDLLGFWVSQFSDVPAALDLPADRPRPAVMSARGALEVRSLSAELVEGLEALGRAEGATLYMVMMAAFAVLLARYTGQDDLVIGAPINLRSRREFEPLIGFFVETLALRMELTGNPTFRELVDRVRDRATGAYAHRDLPFDRLVRALGVKRDLSRPPLYQVTFQLVYEASVPRELGELTVEPLEVDRGAAMADVSLLVERRASGAAVKVEYSTDLFDAERIARMLEHYEVLLEGVVREPEGGIWGLPLLGETERRRVVMDWNATSAPVSAGGRIHEAFERQVSETPNATAVICGFDRVTYSELNQRANALARALRRRGVQPDTIVALFLEREVSLVTAMLGVLKAGGAYLPLDRGHPDDRLRVILEDARPLCVVTTEEARKRLEGLGAATISVEEVEGVGSAGSLEDERAEGDDRNLAYILYTSGSTGTPKGVGVEHRNVMNLLAWAECVFEERELRGVLAATSVTFDPSVFEIFVTLSRGGTVLLADNVLALPQVAARTDVTLVVTVPSLMNELLRVGELPRSVETVCLIGEPLVPELVERIYRAGAVKRCFDFYGPTETTVLSTCALRKPGEPATIGRPISNTAIYLMDRNRQAVPIGVPGELYIGGAGVSRGYVNRPQLSAEAFVVQERADGSEARLYRTGDIARYRADGALEYLGRVDHQVKVDGFRIELGEIEATLRRHPQIRESAARVHTDSTGRRRIHAYVVPREGMDPSVEEVRDFVRARLPQYMVPAMTAVLERIPLTRNGKVDRSALPEIDREAPASARRYQPARSEVERALVEIWSELLRQDRVGVLDDFFELGGDSILAIHMVARAAELGISLRPRMVLEGPTIRELARKAQLAEVVSKWKAPTNAGIPLGPAPRWFLDTDPPDVDHVCLRFVLKLRRALDPDILELALRSLLGRHDALRFRLRRTEEGWEHWVASAEEAGEVLAETLDLSAIPAAERQGAIAGELDRLQEGLNAREGPTCRVRLLNCGPDDPWRLAMVVHHFGFDFISARVCLAELERLYEQIASGQEPNLPPPTAPVGLWNRRLQEYANREAMREESAFWLGQLSSSFRLPIDLSGAAKAPTAATKRRVMTTFDVAETTRALRAIRERLGCSVRDALLSALVRVLYRWTGSTSPQLGVIGHGREDMFDELDASRTVGWLSTRFPLRFDLDAGVSPRAVLQAVRKRLAEVPHQGVGYLALRYLAEAPDTRRLLAAAGEPDVVFDYLGHFGQLEEASTLFSPDAELIGPAMGADTPVREKLGVAAAVTAEGIRMEWSYNTLFHSERTIRLLADWFSEEIAALMSAEELIR